MQLTFQRHFLLVDLVSLVQHANCMEQHCHHPVINGCLVVFVRLERVEVSLQCLLWFAKLFVLPRNPTESPDNSDIILSSQLSLDAHAVQEEESCVQIVLQIVVRDAQAVGSRGNRHRI